MTRARRRASDGSSRRSSSRWRRPCTRTSRACKASPTRSSPPSVRAEWQSGRVPDGRPLTEDDRDWLERVLREETAGPKMVSRGRLHDGLALPGIVAVYGDERAGVLLYHVDAHELEVVFVATRIPGIGAGGVLLSDAIEIARQEGCWRAWLVTTNDNTQAIRFYQQQGWELVAFHRDAREESRKLKKKIPAIGNDGIPIRHELEFEFRLTARPVSG